MLHLVRLALDRRRFVWSVGVSPANWLLLMEMEGSVGVPPANTVLRKYTWGLDLAGQSGSVGILPASLESAGGIGGLLALEDVGDPNDPNDNLSYVYLYDGNGNVGQLVDLGHDPNDPAGALLAKYEYDPYGNVTAKSGDYADANPFRFSTNYWDDETGLGYWGLRYYNPGLGRWLNRDPIDELGGVNLYAYVGNDPVDGVDALGRALCYRYGRPCGAPNQEDGNRCPSQPTTKPQTQPTSKPEPPEPGGENVQAWCQATLHRACPPGQQYQSYPGCACVGPKQKPNNPYDPCKKFSMGENTPINGWVKCIGGAPIICMNPLKPAFETGDGLGGCDTRQAKSRASFCACVATQGKLDCIKRNCPEGCKGVAEGQPPGGNECPDATRKYCTDDSRDTYVTCLKMYLDW
jgi:RHS repeat-associated protein